MISQFLTVAERIPFYLARTTIAENGCWLWNGSLSGGYGNVGVGGKVLKLHVLSYENAYGPVPDGLELDHKCRNRRCWNPDHVEPVTHAVNMQRGAHALKTVCKSGHPYDEINTRLYRGHRYCRECMRIDRRRRRQLRAKRLTPQQRSENARKSTTAHWAKTKEVRKMVYLNDVTRVGALTIKERSGVSVRTEQLPRYGAWTSEGLCLADFRMLRSAIKWAKSTLRWFAQPASGSP